MDNPPSIHFYIMFKDFDIFFDQLNNCYQVRTKTNCFVLDFEDDEKKQVFERLIGLQEEELPKIFQTLKKEFDTGKVINVLADLRDCGLLPIEELASVPELAPDSSNNSNGQQPVQQELKQLEELNILILSDGKVGKKLHEVLESKGLKGVKTISADLFASLSQNQVDETISGADFCFMDASAWNPMAIELLNKSALKHSKPWLHIGGLEEYLLKIGPLFLGNETGCYDCFIKRVKSNHSYIQHFNSYEYHLKQTGKSSKPDQFIHLDSYNEILANVAYLELTKFFQLWSVPTTWKKLLTINALDFDIQSHDLLKVPFCETCNSNQFYNPSPWLEPISILSDEYSSVDKK